MAASILPQGDAGAALSAHCPVERTARGIASVLRPVADGAGLKRFQAKWVLVRVLFRYLYGSWSFQGPEYFTMHKLDKIDRRILRALQEDGRIQNVDLARKVGLSPSPCLRRVRILEESGVIERYVALLDASKIGAGLTIFARIWLKAQDVQTVEIFTEEIKRLPQIVECHLMAGDCDFLLRVVAADLNAYRQFQIDHLTRIKGVQSVKTEIPMQKIKLTSELPL
jgi:Lrp/AsnC family leucine-responsive transcriptional regulator